MGSGIRFTVIIPTRERSDVLRYCLDTVSAQKYDQLTIIVSDNFSQDNTRQVVESFHDARIKYINTGKRLSMSHNYEFALRHVTDGWVTVVGDDDGLLPGALNTVADVIARTGCQAVMSDVCRYNWPGTHDNEDCLVVPLRQGIEIRSARTWLGKVLRGETGYMDLPFLYTGGFVDVQVVNKARSSQGEFYRSLNPDLYSAVAFASLLDNYVMLKEPVAVAGLSAHSTGASAIGANKNKESANKFLSEENIPFDARLLNKDWPRYIPQSMAIYVYECYLQSVHIHHDVLKIKMEDQLGVALARCPKNDYDALRAYCMEIAERNEVSMAVVDRKEKIYSQGRFFRDLGERLYRSLNYRILSGKEFGIRNVHEACLLAKVVFLSETRYAGWRLKKLFQGIRKVFKI